MCTVDSSDVLYLTMAMIIEKGLLSLWKGDRHLWEGRAIVLISKWMTNNINITLHDSLEFFFHSAPLSNKNKTILKNSVWPPLRPQHQTIMCLRWLQAEYIFFCDRTEITHFWDRLLATSIICYWDCIFFKIKIFRLSHLVKLTSGCVKWYIASNVQRTQERDAWVFDLRIWDQENANDKPKQTQKGIDVIARHTWHKDTCSHTSSHITEKLHFSIFTSYIFAFNIIIFVLK